MPFKKKKQAQNGNSAAISLEPKTFAEKKKYFLRRVKQSSGLYVLFFLPFVYYIVFKYLPIPWLALAFKKYKPALGLWGSPWVGLKWFQMFIQDPSFWNVVKNTVLLSFWSLVFGFPAPIILALLINEMRSKVFKKTVQTISYLPNFISTVVVCGFITTTLALSGPVNTFLKSIGLQAVAFLNIPEWFRPIYISSGIWQGCGWGSIIYLAALAGIEQQLYEAAIIDGANRWDCLVHISLPGIAPVISIQLLLAMGGLLSVGYEKIILLYNGMTRSTADVISSYVFRNGIEDANYSYGAAVGLFESVIGLISVNISNKIADKIGQTSLW